MEGTLEMLEKRVHKLAEHNSGDKGRGNNVDEGKLDSLVDEVYDTCSLKHHNDDHLAPQTETTHRLPL